MTGGPVKTIVDKLMQAPKIANPADIAGLVVDIVGDRNSETNWTGVN
jgi:hypothetical protein